METLKIVLSQHRVWHGLCLRDTKKDRTYANFVLLESCGNLGLDEIRFRAQENGFLRAGGNGAFDVTLHSEFAMPGETGHLWLDVCMAAKKY